MSRRPLMGLLVLLSFACSPDRPTAPGSSLADAEAKLVGREVASEVEDVAGSFTLGGLLIPSFPSAGLPEGIVLRPSGTGLCPTITPNPPVDTDGDRIPDDATISFTLPDCAFALNGATLEITGSIRVTDLSSTDFGIRVVFDNLDHKFTRDGGATFENNLNGARQVLRSASSFDLHDSTTVDFTSGDHAAQLAKAWVVTFTADAGETFDGLRRLPSGNLTVNGSLSRTRNATTQTFAVTTVTPLHHDATCDARPSFTSGELTVTKTGPDGTVTIHIVFNGCGVDPTVTVERSTA